MNYSAKSSTIHLLNRINSRPRINHSRFNLKDKKTIKDTSLSFVAKRNNTELSTTQLFTFKKIYPTIQKEKPSRYFNSPCKIGNSQLIDYKIQTIFNSVMKKDVQNINNSTKIENRINQLNVKCDNVVIIKSKIDDLSNLYKNIILGDIHKVNKIETTKNNKQQKLSRLDTLDLIGSCKDNRMIRN